MGKLIVKLERNGDKYASVAPLGGLLFNALPLLMAPNPFNDSGTEISFDIYRCAFIALIAIHVAFAIFLIVLALLKSPFFRSLFGTYMFHTGPLLNAVFFAFFVIGSWKIQMFTVCVCFWSLWKTYRSNAQVAHFYLTRNLKHFYEMSGEDYLYRWDGIDVLKEDYYKNNPCKPLFNASMFELFALLLAYPVVFLFYIRGVSGTASDEAWILFSWFFCLTCFYTIRSIIFETLIHMRMISLIKKRLAENRSET
ncbi:hypothetical protein [Roseinatronobacter monicus]|uniref:Uncharacterized protein n=1 Tax=Roseinatronobacter monicus TaxID=393481 RepID=A0A543K637_9RHOB|nr:hypothetical protein [Roseinatronobacter monicus]TQM90531.1 hypothetical protein BD293_3924 [Roseinatronobacter monicus]